MKTNFITYLIIFCSQAFVFSQSNLEKIVVANYILYPYSTEFFNHDSETPNKKKSFDIALRRTKKFNYTLISNFKSSKAVFILDSITTTPIKGKESFWIEPEDVVYYAFKKNNNIYKKETILKNDFYIVKNDFSYEWEITNERKKIAGFECIKAVSNKRGNKIIAWFTNKIPINYGPLGLYGLPGLILEAETFFNTITVTNLKYLNSNDTLKKEINIIEKKYNEEKGADEIKESVLLLKKGGLIKQLKMMN